MWNCCFFSSVTFLYIFSFSNTFFRIFSPPSWMSNRHVCQRSPRKKKKTGFDSPLFEHILRIVFIYCLLRNQRFHTPNCILFLSRTQQSWISIFHRMTLSILPSNLLLKQNIDHVQYLLWEYFICKLFNCINIL